MSPSGAAREGAVLVATKGGGPVPLVGRCGSVGSTDPDRIGVCVEHVGPVAGAVLPLGEGPRRSRRASGDVLGRVGAVGLT